MAGGLRGGDILKCRQKPVAAADYNVVFSPDEVTRLMPIFSNGVCD